MIKDFASLARQNAYKAKRQNQVHRNKSDRFSQLATRLSNKRNEARSLAKPAT